MDISVIIPVYNAEEYVEKAVSSALQFSRVREILLIEDGSPDRALEVCRRLEAQHDRVRLLQHPDKGNHGAGASRNLGLEHASSPFVAFLDADDFYLPNRFEADQRVFTENPAAEGVYNALGVHFYSNQAEDYFRRSNLRELTTVTSHVDPQQLFESLIGFGVNYGYFHIDSVTIKRDVLGRMGHWFDPSLTLHQDTEFLVRLAYLARLFPGELERPVVMRGVHEGNRITNVQLESRKKAAHQKRLWVALCNWAVEQDIQKEYRDHIRRMAFVKSLPVDGFVQRWRLFFAGILRDGRLFLDPLYYNVIHFSLFGEGRIARFLLRLKNVFFRFLHKNGVS